MPKQSMLKVNEVFCSIQGEGFWTGTPAVFIRLSGCNRKCSFCDTKHEEGEYLYVKDILEQIPSNYKHVIITGGEPCLQGEGLIELVDAIDHNQVMTHIETNGDFVDILRELHTVYNVWITVSPKGNIGDIPWEGYTIADELKFVMRDEGDLYHPHNAYAGLARTKLKTPIFLQPVSQDEEATWLCFKECLRYPDKFRLSLQMHKFINVP